MNKLLVLLFSIICIQSVSQTCVSKASSYFEASQMRMTTNTKANIGTMLEFPKRSQEQIKNGSKGKFMVFDGGIHAVSIKGNRMYKSESSYTGNPTQHWTPGPIDIRSGDVDWMACEEYDRIWYIDRPLVDNHIIMVKNTFTFPISISDIPKEILEWPAKGNKRYTKVPISDDLAPFYDFNKNGIYDPEYGDYPIFKGDQAQFIVVNDLYNQRYRADTALGIEMHIMIYNYSYTYPLSNKNAIFYDVSVTKKTSGDIDSFIFSLFFDTDLGNNIDDYIGLHSESNSVFTYNADSFDESNSNGVENYGANPPVFVSSSIQPDMKSCAIYYQGMNLPTIYPNSASYYLPNDSLLHYYSGNPSYPLDSHSMAARNLSPRDWRYLQNTAPTVLKYNQPKQYEFMLYAYQYPRYKPNPNVYDSVLKPLEDVKKNVPKKNCTISFNALVKPSTDGQKNGSVELRDILGASPIVVKWSTNETANKITSKDSGYYHVVVIDANNCMKDSTYYIPNIIKGTGAILPASLENLLVYPNPFLNHLTIGNPQHTFIEKIYIDDALGHRVREISINSKNETSELNLTSLSKGHYILSIITKEGIRNIKIMK